MARITVTEGAALAEVPTAQVVSKEMEVFYNPVMKTNRDVTVLLLHALAPEFPDGYRIGSPLAGSGVRECRFLCELGAGAVKELAINDYSPDAVALIKKNLKKNRRRFAAGIAAKDVHVSCDEANKFLLGSSGFTYIDLDPFGTPNPFLDAACKRLQRGGILGVTATDTSALAGTYASACRRKYWAEPMRNHLMHEVGLRILARKVQLVAAQYEKALTPIYSYSQDHYLRIFFCNERSKKAADKVQSQHLFLHYCPSCLKVTADRRNAKRCCRRATRVAGPLYAGRLWDAALAKRMAALNRTWEWGQPERQKLLETIAREAQANVLGFYPFNLARKLGKYGTPRRKEDVLGRAGVWPTHLESNAVRARRLKLLF